MILVSPLVNPALTAIGETEVSLVMVDVGSVDTAILECIAEEHNDGTNGKLINESMVSVPEDSTVVLQLCIPFLQVS